MLSVAIFNIIVMTWTRLFHLTSLKGALKRTTALSQTTEFPISKRYQAQIRKEFRLAGVPWIYDLREQAPNPRDRRPKPKKREQAKVLRHEKIEKLLKEAPAKELEYRQTRLNNRRLRGMDEMFAKGLPSWIKGDTNEVPHYMRRKKDDEE